MTLDDMITKLEYNDPEISTLTLNDLTLDIAVSRRIASALKMNRFLTSLTLFNNNLGDEGAKAIAEALEKNSTLNSLSLVNNEVSSKGGEAIAKALKKNSALNSLNLSSNAIGAKGFKAILSALGCHSTLTILDLSWNKIKGEECEEIPLEFEMNSTLTELNLSKNKIGDKGAQAIAKALEKNSGLRVLRLEDSSIGPDGGIAMAKMLNKNSGLTHLDLSINDMKAGSSGINAPLKKTWLTYINLDKTGIQPGVKNAIFEKVLLNRNNSNSGTSAVTDQVKTIFPKPGSDAIPYDWVNLIGLLPVSQQLGVIGFSLRNQIYAELTFQAANTGTKATVDFLISNFVSPSKPTPLTTDTGVKKLHIG